MPDLIQDYLTAVTEQIHSKRDAPTVKRELYGHLEEQKEAYMAQGLDAQTAEAEAVRQMGDPVLLGRELDRVHRPKYQGLVRILSALIFAYLFIAPVLGWPWPTHLAFSFPHHIVDVPQTPHWIYDVISILSFQLLLFIHAALVAQLFKPGRFSVFCNRFLRVVCVLDIAVILFTLKKTNAAELLAELELDILYIILLTFFRYAALKSITLDVPSGDEAAEEPTVKKAAVILRAAVLLLSACALTLGLAFLNRSAGKYELEAVSQEVRIDIPRDRIELSFEEVRSMLDEKGVEDALRELNVTQYKQREDVNYTWFEVEHGYCLVFFDKAWQDASVLEMCYSEPESETEVEALQVGMKWVDVWKADKSGADSVFLRADGKGSDCWSPMRQYVSLRAGGKDAPKTSFHFFKSGNCYEIRYDEQYYITEIIPFTVYW